MGLVASTAEGWNQSFLAYGKMMSEQDSKPAARTPSEKSGTKRKLSSSTGSSRTKKGT
jgi:hypothetical protein